MTDPLEDLDQILRSGTRGEIRARNVTHWDLRLEAGALQGLVRVHFGGKLESRHVSDQFAGGGLYSEHPVLRDSVEARAGIYLSERVEEAAELLDEVRAVVNDWSDGWRTADEYLNAEIWTEDTAEAASGELLEGPRSLVTACARALRLRAVNFSTTPSGRPSSAVHQLLLCGSSFVVARRFEVENVTT